MKYKLPIGSRITRYTIAIANQHPSGHNIFTTKEVTYTEIELGPKHINVVEGFETYYTISIPVTDGYNMIKVYRKDLVDIEMPEPTVFSKTTSYPQKGFVASV